MKTTVIYHSADFDGIFCREIARKFLPDADLIGWNFGDPKIPFPEGQVYVMDLSAECLDAPNEGLVTGYWDRLIWIDHHKTAIEKWCKDIRGYRIDGVAACRLAWQWFAALNDSRNSIGLPSGIQAPLPIKQDFIDRKVSEPLAVRLAGEYDIWDKRDCRAETFQYALRAVKGEIKWGELLSPDYHYTIESMLEAGEWCQSYAQNVDASICKSSTWIMEWEGLKFLCVNSARFNSLFFASKDLPETGHEALMGFCYHGNYWMVSLYHSKHRTDLDLSNIAKKYGGGGHRGSCGFTCKTLPFVLSRG